MVAPSAKIRMLLTNDPAGISRPTTPDRHSR
jgi:hypothetical protein